MEFTKFSITWNIWFFWFVW